MIIKISIDASFGKKSFKDLIGYKDDEKVNPSNTIFPKINGYTKFFDETKCRSCLKIDDVLQRNITEFGI